MRQLTFGGFLSRYVRELSYADTNSVRTLVKESASKNPRLREPLFLYSLYHGKLDLMRKEAAKNGLESFFRPVAAYTTCEAMEHALQQGGVPNEYVKVWKSYLAKRNWLEADNGTKERIRKKVVVLQQEKGITNYRIYTDLHLNPGNLNAWLKNNDQSKLSLETARNVLTYVQNQKYKAAMRNH